MIRRFTAVLASGALLWAAGPVAVAQSSSPPTEAAASPQASSAAAVLPIAVDGEIAESDRATLTKRLLEGLERGRFSVIPPSAVASTLPVGEDCAQARCLTNVAVATRSSHVVRTVVVARDRDYTVTVELIDGRTGETVAKAVDGCEICGVADVGTLLGTQAATLRSKLEALASGPATLILNSDPSGAVVSIDGSIVGTSPLELAVAPGDHVVRAQHEGYIAVERQVTFVEGVIEPLDLDLEEQPSRLPGRTWGLVSLGAGIAALGVGVTFTAMHSDQYRPDCDPANGTQDAAGECRFLWNTKWGGMASAAVGTALITFGTAVLLNRPRSSLKPPERDTAQVIVGPGSIGVRGRF
ncbi:MAG: PEGA domain-containing protein [Myxococcales bacterium FL481]|nr:MAG: PEGA domain-containing protein [Myxococcales bacterium FL481]